MIDIESLHNILGFCNYKKKEEPFDKAAFLEYYAIYRELLERESDFENAHEYLFTHGKFPTAVVIVPQKDGSYRIFYECGGLVRKFKTKNNGVYNLPDQLKDIILLPYYYHFSDGKEPLA